MTCGIEKCLKKFKSASRAEIDRLLLDKISNALSVDQRQKKISNLLQAMRIKGVIENNGTNRNPVWKLKKNN